MASKSLLLQLLLLAGSLGTRALAQSGRAEFKQAAQAYEAGNYQQSLAYLSEAERALGGSNAKIQSLRTLNYYDQGNTQAALAALTQYFRLATGTTRAAEEYKNMEALREELKATNEARFAEQKKAIAAAQARELAALDHELTGEKEAYYYNLVKNSQSPKAIQEFLNQYPQSAGRAQLEARAQELEQAQDKMKNPEKYLFGAIEQRNQALFEELLSYGPAVDDKNASGQYPLHLAIEKNNLAMVRQLLKYGANQEVKDRAGNTPLLLALRLNQEAAATELLLHGAKVAVSDAERNGPVFFAIANNSAPQLQQLILLRAEVSSVNQAGLSPLLAAIAQPGIDPKIIYTLLNGGARADQLVAGYTALHYAVRDNKTKIAEILLRAGADANVRVPGGTTLLYQATANGNAALAELLLAAKADPNTPSANGWAPLHYAAWKGNAPLASALLAHGAQVSVRGSHDWTPLHYATRENNQPMVELLLAKKADKKAVDSWKRTPLKIAREYHFKALKRKLS